MNAPHPDPLYNSDYELYKRLLRIRYNLSQKHICPEWFIASNASLRSLAHYRPERKELMYHISGFKKKKIKWFGDAFLGAIRRYNQKHYAKL